MSRTIAPMLHLLILLNTAHAEGPVDVLRHEGCLSCHTVNGAPSVGPPLDGLIGRVETVASANSAAREVTVDEDYVRRSLIEPGADLVQGYASGVMQPASAARVDALVVAIAALPAGATPPATGTIAELVLACAAFLGTHLALSSITARTPLSARLGPNGFLVVYSVVTGSAFGWMVWAWSRAPFIALWAPFPWTRWVPLIAMPFVLVGMMAGYLTPSPTISGASGLLDGPIAPRGIQTITRHPVNLTTSLWGIAHLFPNGDVAAVLLFGTVAALGVVGSLHIDQRLRATRGQAWARYEAQTSFVPFAAIFAGRATLDLRGIGVWRVGIGIAVFLLALALHTWLIGVSPFPTW